MVNNYVDDSVNNQLLEKDIIEFFKTKWIDSKSYSFWIERHLLWDWKHRITIDFDKWNSEKTIDINAWDTKEYLYEVLNNIIS